MSVRDDRPEYDHIRAIARSLITALARRLGSARAADRFLAGEFGVPYGEPTKWLEEPWRVSLFTRRTLARLASQSAADVAHEGDEAVGIQLRVLTAREVAAHIVAVRTRNPDSTDPRDMSDPGSAEFLFAITHSPPVKAPEVDRTERDRWEAALLAEDDDHMEWMRQQLPPP